MSISKPPGVPEPKRATAFAALLLLFFPRYDPPLAVALETWEPASPELRRLRQTLVQEIDAAWRGLYRDMMDCWSAESKIGGGDIFRWFVKEFLEAGFRSLTPPEREQAERRFGQLTRRLFQLLVPVLDHAALLAIEIGDPAALSRGAQIRARLGQEPDAAKRLQKQLVDRLGRLAAASRFLDWVGYCLEHEKRGFGRDPDLAIDRIVALPGALHNAFDRAGPDAPLGTVFKNTFRTTRRVARNRRDWSEKAITFTETFELPKHAPVTPRDRNHVRDSLRDDSSPETELVRQEEEEATKGRAQRALAGHLAALDRRWCALGYRADRRRTFRRIERYRLTHPEAKDREIARTLRLSPTTLKNFNKARKVDAW